MTGAATQQSGSNGLTAFRYQMSVEIDPWNFDTGYTPVYAPSTSANLALNYTNLMAVNLHEVRLRFAWPVLPNGSVGPGRQTYRSLICSHLLATNTGVYQLWFFQPQVYTNNL